MLVQDYKAVGLEFETRDVRARLNAVLARRDRLSFRQASELVNLSGKVGSGNWLRNECVRPTCLGEIACVIPLQFSGDDSDRALLAFSAQLSAKLVSLARTKVPVYEERRMITRANRSQEGRQITMRVEQYPMSANAATKRGADPRLVVDHQNAQHHTKVSTALHATGSHRGAPRIPSEAPTILFHARA